jgi:hypothetical protein
MKNELSDLFKVLNDNKKYELKNKIASLILKFSFDQELKEISKENLPKGIEVDLNELESLINPEKFNFPEPNIGRVEIESVN